MAAPRRDLAEQGKSIVARKCDPAPCSVVLPVSDLSRAAREAGAGTSCDRKGRPQLLP
jgi:hypothetical protein